MTYTTATRFFLIATTGLLLIARPGMASEGTAPPATQAQDTPETTEVTPDMTPPAIPNEHIAEVVPIEDEIDIEVEPTVDPVDTVETPDAPDTPDTQIFQTTPIDMDRAGWPTILVTPTDGSVTHNPGYMGNPPMGDDIVTPLHAPDPVWQIQEALAGADAGNLNGENLSALGAQPFIGLAQFGLIPVRAVFENPLSDTTSP